MLGDLSVLGETDGLEEKRLKGQKFEYSGQQLDQFQK